MRSLKMTFGGKNAVSVDWNKESSGFGGLVQKVTNAVMTQHGTDVLVDGRGTHALKELVGHGAFDLMSIQHTLNFAALKARMDVLQYEGTSDPDYTLRSVQLLLAGVKNNAAKAIIAVTNSAGLATNNNLIID